MVTTPAATVLGLVGRVLAGSAVDYPRGERSAIDKRPVDGPVQVGPLGLAGDEQGDPVYHGGPAKAVHHYAWDHYAWWRAELGALPVLDAPGAFGENISTTGITEDDVYIGDLIRIGSTMLRVSQGRRPCWKLGVRFGVPDMARRVLSTGRTGWYYAVVEPGLIRAGDEITVVDRPHPDWPMSRLLHLVLHRGGTVTELREAVELPLPTSWRETLERRLRTGTQIGEDWME